MVYFKSIVVGLATMLMVAIASSIIFVAVALAKSRNLPEGTAIGWDPVSLFRNSLVPWLILFAAFVVGFWWEYRKSLG